MAEMLIGMCFEEALVQKMGNQLGLEMTAQVTYYSTMFGVSLLMKHVTLQSNDYHHTVVMFQLNLIISMISQIDQLPTIAQARSHFLFPVNNCLICKLSTTTHSFVIETCM